MEYPILIKVGYGYLLSLAFISLIKSILISAYTKLRNYEKDFIFNILLIGIMCLSVIQIWQCIDLIRLPLGKSWWIPFFCKHGALILYIVVLNMLKYKIDNPCNLLESSKEGLCHE